MTPIVTDNITGLLQTFMDVNSKRAEVTANYLGDVERGQRNPTMKVVARILAGLRVSWVEFAQLLDSRE